MGVRTDIQAKLIALFKVNEYEVVSYDELGIPSVGETKETPIVVCNEISANLSSNVGQTNTLLLTGWSFELRLNFQQEVDYSDFVLGLSNISYAYNSDTLVAVNLGSSILVNHPVREGGHTGTELVFNLNVDIKK